MSIYSIEEFKVWKGINPDEPTWHNINIFPGNRSGAEEILEVLQKNSPERTFRIVTFVSQQGLDKLRGQLKQAHERVRSSEQYAAYVAEEIAEMKREAHRQGVELK